MEQVGCEQSAQGLDSEFSYGRNLIRRFHPAQAPEMAPVGERQRAAIELERNVNMHSLASRPGRLLGLRWEPNQLAVQPKVYGELATVEPQQEVFPAPLHAEDLPLLGAPAKRCRTLRTYSDRMDHPAAHDSPPPHKRCERPCHRLHFGQLWHRKSLT